MLLTTCANSPPHQGATMDVVHLFELAIAMFLAIIVLHYLA